MIFVLERKAEDWQCDCDAEDWDGWQEVSISRDKAKLSAMMKDLKKCDEESDFRLVVE